MRKTIYTTCFLLSILLFVSLINLLFSIANLATSTVDAKNITYTEGMSSSDYTKSLKRGIVDEVPDVTITETERETYKKLTDYSIVDTDIQYHDDMETISKQPEIYGLPSGTKFRTDKDGNKYMTLVDNNFTYYEPDKMSKFGPQQYVPSYEDSIYLSKYNTEMKNSLYNRS